MKQLYTLFLFSALFIACNGQPNTAAPGDSVKNKQGHAKLVKTQGSNEYANVHCGLQDKDGNLWFGTTGEGVYKYDGKLFTNYTKDDGLGSNEVWCVYQGPNGTLWFGTGDGASQYNPANNTFTNHQIPGISSKLTTNPSAYTPNAVWSILLDKSGKYWFGTSNGIYCFDGKSFTPFLNANIVNPKGLQLNYVQSIIEDKNGDMLFGSSYIDGISRFDGKTLTAITPDKFGRIMSGIQTKNGEYLYGNVNGVYRYDGTNLTNITKELGLELWVYSVVEDAKGNLWFSSENGTAPQYEDGGLWRYNPSATLKTGSKEYTRFTTADGLPSNAVFCVVEDKDGNIWVGTRNTGLCRYNPTTNNFTDFTDYTLGK